MGSGASIVRLFRSLCYESAVELVAPQVPAFPSLVVATAMGALLRYILWVATMLPTSVILVVPSVFAAVPNLVRVLMPVPQVELFIIIRAQAGPSVPLILLHTHKELVMLNMPAKLSAAMGVVLVLYGVRWQCTACRFIAILQFMGRWAVLSEGLYRLRVITQLGEAPQ